MDAMRLRVPARETTPGLMEAMEREGLIIRICPHQHDIPAPAGETCFESLYEGAEDFYLLKAKYNDPEVSSFAMKKGIPHGEGIFDSEGMNPSFYVTESRDLPLDLCGMGDYTVEPAGSQLARYWLGVQPVTFLKEEQKELSLEKPRL